MGDKLAGTWEQWILEKSKMGDGVLIRSRMHGKYLTRTNSNKLSTVYDATSMSIWTFDSAHKNIFYLYNSSHKQFVANKEGKYLTVNENCTKATKWKIVFSDCTNEVALQNMDSHQWLAIADNGDLVSEAVKQTWTMKESPHNGKILTNVLDRSKNLGFDGNEFYLCENEGTWETWELHPVLPQSITLIQRPICAWESW